MKRINFISFDLKKALAGEKVVTRLGLLVHNFRIKHKFRTTNKFKYEADVDGENISFSFTDKGLHLIVEKSDFDLYMG